MSLKIPALVLASIMMLGGVVGISATANAQPFDITSEQGDQEALITVKLATNNTVVIPPNGTIIEVPGNITQVDNNTVVITPDNETVTTTPGNVTVIDPPVPEPCGCPPIEVEQPAPGIPPVTVQPAPGQEVITQNGTELIVNETQEVPIPEPEPVPAPDNGNTTEIPIGQPEDNQTGAGDNETGFAPAAFNEIFPWMSSA